MIKNKIKFQMVKNNIINIHFFVFEIKKEFIQIPIFSLNLYYKYTILVDRREEYKSIRKNRITR